MASHSDRSTLRAARVQRIIDDCVRRRAAGESLPDEAVIAAHAELMPELADALRGLAIVGAAFDRVLAGPADSSGESSETCSDALMASATLSAAKSAGGDLAAIGFALRRRAARDLLGSSDRRAEITLPPQRRLKNWRNHAAPVAGA